MKIMKLNEWKCDMNIDDADVYVEPTGALKDMIEHFGLIYNPRTGRYDCDEGVNLYAYYNEFLPAERAEFDKAFVNDGKMTIKFGTVGGYFFLPGSEYHPYILTSLEGCPETVGSDFDCGYNKLTTLKGCPETVGGYFNCGHNRLISLEHSPKTVANEFNCEYNRIMSLDGCPKTVGGDFVCNNNKVEFTKKDVRDRCDVKGIIVC